MRGELTRQLRVSGIERRFAIYRACAEIWLAERGIRFQSETSRFDTSNAIAAALQAPAPAFLDAVDELGQCAFAELATEFCATQTSMALRIGEVCNVPVMVEYLGVRRVRGNARAWHKRHKTRRIVLTDDSDRFVYLAA